MSEQLKPCPFCPSLPIERPDSYIPGAVACPMGHTSPMLKSEWNLRQPPADAKWPEKKEKGYFLKDITHADKELAEIQAIAMKIGYSHCKDLYDAELRRVGVI